MDKPEAETIYASGKDATVATLLKQDQQIKELKKKLASLSQNSSNSSKPPSSDGPGAKRYPKKSKPSRRNQADKKGTKERNEQSFRPSR